MHLNLTFEDGSIFGEGGDVVGRFEIEGSYNGDSVEFVKRYSYFGVTYTGSWDGGSISGRWRIREALGFEKGEFEIWPEAGEVGIREESKVEELVATV